MATKYDTLHLDIAGEAVDRIKLFPDSDPKKMAEELKKAYDLNDSKQEWQIYFYKESKLNKTR